MDVSLLKLIKRNIFYLSIMMRVFFLRTLIKTQEFSAIGNRLR